MKSDDGNGERGLRPREQTPEQALGAPFAAMAEALRANAEALRRIDENQRKIAESLEKGDRAQKLVSNTQALNETFRGLSDIQRGLLDAVVKDRGRGRGLPFAFAAIAILAALLGFLLYERWTADESVSRGLYDQTQQAKEGLAAQVGDLRARIDDLTRREAAAKETLEESDRKLAAARRDASALQGEKSDLESELATKQSRLKEYIAVKEVADRTGAVEIRNMQLEAENRGLKEKVERIERERERLMELLGEERIANRGPDPAEILKSAEKLGVVPKDHPPPPEGSAVLTSSQRRRVRREINHLLQQPPGEEAYEVLEFGGISDGTRLIDVTVGRYRNATMLNSLNCKELEIVVDLEEDTIELRFREGFIVNTRKPSDKIPIGEDGHFVFLKEAGARDWLRRSDGLARMGEDGTLAWSTGRLLK